MNTHLDALIAQHYFGHAEVVQGGAALGRARLHALGVTVQEQEG